jgi:hypothetical protein
MVTVDLLLEVLLTLIEVSKRFGHAVDFFLPLQSHSVFAANIVCNGIQNALIAIVARDLPLFLEFKQEKYGMSLHFTERQPAKQHKNMPGENDLRPTIGYHQVGKLLEQW